MKNSVEKILVNDAELRDYDVIKASKIKEMLDVPLKSNGYLIQKATFCRVRVRPDKLADYADQGDFFKNKNYVWVLGIDDENFVGLYCVFAGKIFIVRKSDFIIRWSLMDEAIYKWDEYANEEGEDIILMRHFVCFPKVMWLRHDRERLLEEIEYYD